MGPVTSLPEVLRRRLGAFESPDNHRLRLAGAGDLGALDRLNAEVVAGCGGEHMFGRMDEGFFERMFAAGGAVLLIADGGTLLGYSVAVPRGRTCRPFIRGTRGSASSPSCSIWGPTI